MYKPTLPILPLALMATLMGTLLNSGCAYIPKIFKAKAESGQTVSKLPAKTQARRPAPDPRHMMPLGNNRSLTVYLDSQTFEYVEDGQVVISGHVSSGSTEHPTPTGDYRVLSKSLKKRSGSYTNYFDENTPMPYAIQFFGAYFIHEGWLPGYADSHGCVRINRDDAKLLFHRIQTGDSVQIKRQGVARPSSLKIMPQRL